MNIYWDEKAWLEYLYWQMQDKKTLKRINNLLKDIDRKIENEQIKILECGTHYGDK